MSKNYIIGIDLGGTKISGVLCDLNGNIIGKHTISTNASEGEDAVLLRIISVIDEVMRLSNKTVDLVKAIGIGSPGPLNAKTGIILTSANLPFKNFKLVEPIRAKYGVPTFLDNDANVAAIGEFMFGAGKGTENMVYITVSTGVGGGAVLNGKIYRGSTNNSLEIGHMTVMADGPKCNCGNYGCIEAISSGTAIGRQAKVAIESGIETSLKKYENVTSYEVYLEAQDGDKIAKEILDNSLNYLGICVANIITTFDPDMIIIGGGVSQIGEILFEKVREVVNERCFKSMAEFCKIVPAALGTSAGVIGAAGLAIMESK